MSAFDNKEPDDNSVISQYVTFSVPKPKRTSNTPASKPTGSFGQKIYKLGEKGSGFKRKNPQDFYALREECLKKKVLFNDPDFPANISSLSYSKQIGEDLVWKRPHEISKNPQFFVEGSSRFDVKQGELGDCWLLVAVANLTLRERLFYQVVPYDQGFKEKYAGIFHFRFWQYGRWIDVVIDDKLPTRNGYLVYLHSIDKNEFWSALFEKAYAKLHGSYEALQGGLINEAMVDFTGGLSEMCMITSSSSDLFQIILKAIEKSSLIGAIITQNANGKHENITSHGLVEGHAYSITKACYVGKDKTPLLRIRNPWGDYTEWNGTWSDKSAKWHSISERERKELGLKIDNDGEFWISLEHFMKYFSGLEICHLNVNLFNEEELRHKKHWEVAVLDGEWVRGATAGGCNKYSNTFWRNPQYRVTLSEADDDGDGKCTLIVALMQKHRRSQQNKGLNNLNIGFYVYHLPNPEKVPKPLDINFFKQNTSVGEVSGGNLREVVYRFVLPPGTYCIVPCTFKPFQEGEFLLRVFSEHKSNMEENDVQIGFKQLEISQVNEFNNEIYEFFKKSADEEGEIGWMQLKDVLDYAMKLEFQSDGFSKELCRSMITMIKFDHSGKLQFEEFNELWTGIKELKTAFRLYDKDNSGTLDGFELRETLAAAGINVNYQDLNTIMRYYGNQEGQMEFEDFMTCAVQLKIALDMHNNNTLEEQDQVESIGTVGGIKFWGFWVQLWNRVFKKMVCLHL